MTQAYIESARKICEEATKGPIPDANYSWPECFKEIQDHNDPNWKFCCAAYDPDAGYLAMINKLSQLRKTLETIGYQFGLDDIQEIRQMARKAIAENNIKENNNVK